MQDKKRLSSRDIRLRKFSKNPPPLVALTAYSAPIARILDAHTDILLVGDSVGMVLYGFDSTLPVTLEMMIRHGAAVVNASSSSCVVVDMPFGTYQESKQSAFRHAAMIMRETGCQAVKLEGGEVMAETVAFLTRRGIPVLGHVGLLPQSMQTQGGYRYQGRTNQERDAIKRDAEALAEAGAFALVLEGISAKLAAEITQAVPIPTIGIGASGSCDGQILVTEDMLGLSANEVMPRFVKTYTSLRTSIDQAAEHFARDVRSGDFPEAQHEYEPE